MFEIAILLGFLVCGAIITVVLFKVALVLVLLPFKLVAGMLHVVAVAVAALVALLLVPILVVLLIPVFIVLFILALPLIVLWGILQFVF